MTRGVSWFLVAPLVLLGLSACKFSPFEAREPWRAEAEERCLAEGSVKSSAYTTPIREIEGAGTCGMEHPFKVSGLVDGSVEVSPKATLACPMTASVDRWLTDDVQPAAIAWFGQPVARVKQISSYSCRNMNGAKTGKISEHAYGNALDISGFILADGREVMVKTGWKGRPDESGFLRTVQASACERFTTVLAPGSNIYHYDHIHVDLMRRSSGRVTCNPAPSVPRPPNMPIFKAPPMASPMVSRPFGGAPVAEMPVDEQDVGAPEELAPAPVYAAPARQQRQEQGRAVPVRTAPVYATPAPNYPAQGNAAQGYPAPARAPAQGYPAQGYPAPSQATGAPMVLSPNAAPSPYGHGVDPNYQSPAPAYPAQPYPPAQGYPAQGYPAQAYPAAQPAASPYPAQGYPAQGYPAQAPKPTRSLPPGVPLPPAGIPLAKWLGLDKTVTGSTGNVRSFTSEREFASPIKVPQAESGGD